MAKDLKILLVNDNTDNPNIGCRATSIALGRLLTAIGTISGSIKKELADRKQTAKPGRSALRIKAVKRIAGRLSKKKSNDWITVNLDANVETVLSRRHGLPEVDGLLEQVVASDIVVINGEGSAIFRPRPRRDLLFQLTVAKLCIRLGKPVHYVNAMISDSPGEEHNQATCDLFFDTIRSCSSLVVRDPESLRFAESKHADLGNASYLPDALFSWHDRFVPLDAHMECVDWLAPFGEEFSLINAPSYQAPYIVVGGSSLVVEDQDRAYASYRKLLHSLSKLPLRLVLLPCCVRDEPFLTRLANEMRLQILSLRSPVFGLGAILAHARAFVSGRYHPAILASFGGTPCVFLGSNSHKTRSLQEVLGYNEIIEYNAWPSYQEIQDIVARVSDAEALGEANRALIRQSVAKQSVAAKALPELIRSRSFLNPVVHGKAVDQRQRNAVL